MHHLVREYARQMSSVQHLLWDLTLPIMSIFNGVGFDRVVRETFKHGAQQIEDLWLSTNLSKGESSVHEQGPLWRLVRASMTIVGMVPPVYYKGDLLVDGGYMNNIPVDVMRSMGVDTVRPS
ncbi:Neuropathy target esterase [Acarospora aff. strigata]|nr:Neuropathy target esterase [Acarospora aff. strigata]